ncbi:hypothetical protein [Candidatus Lokiarchaeum ossiferum]|uniref:hypothetical protein n=1 Tax=Candidatus Lokiarchaeum ossiferum TaxID=2951803 RepID=UPI00352DC77F
MLLKIAAKNIPDKSKIEILAEKYGLQLSHFEFDDSEKDSRKLIAMYYDIPTKNEPIQLYAAKSEEEQLFKKLTDALDILEEGTISLVHEMDVKHLPIIRKIKDKQESGLEFSFFLDEGTIYSTSSEENEAMYEGNLTLLMKNITDQPVTYEQVHITPCGFRLGDLQGNELLTMLGKKLDTPQPNTINPGEIIVGNVPWNIKKGYPGVYILYPITSEFVFSGQTKQFSFEPIQIQLK